MVDLGCPLRGWFVRTLIVFAAGAVSPIQAQSVTIAPRWLVRTAPGGGKGAESIAIPTADGKFLVVVLAAGGKGPGPMLMLGNQPVAATTIGYDEVSRLGFLQPDESTPPKPVPWLDEAPAREGVAFQYAGSEGPGTCRGMGRVKQFGGKILPLALLKVNFGLSVPPPGTPLLDASGRVAAVMFQEDAGGKTGYAIPAEAVHRVQKDICSEGRLIRGWLGLSLRAESTIPKIVRILPDSPAAGAGILADDILLAVGTRAIADYGDAVNAFFYLIPGRPVRVRIQRAGSPLDFMLTPVRANP